MYGDVARLIPEARLVELPGEDYTGIFLEDPAREIAPTDHAAGVRRVVVLGSRLGEVDAATTHTRDDIVRRLLEWDVGEAA